MTKYKEGDKVEYKPIGGPQTMVTSQGVITKVLTSTGPAGNTQVSVKASEDHPRYEIENSHTGKRAGLAEANIMRKIE